MVSGDNPLDFFFNPISVVVKEAILPLEMGVRKAAKDLQHCRDGIRNKGNEAQLIAFAQENEGGKLQICGQRVFSQHSGNLNGGQVLGGRLKDKEVTAKEEGSCAKKNQFAIDWSLLANGFLQALPTTFKSRGKRFQEMGDEDKLSCSVNHNV